MRFSLFWRLALILFLFYMSLRVEFLGWNFRLFAHENLSDLVKAFWVGIPFDMVSISWTLLPVVLWGWLIGRFYWIPFFLIQIPLWLVNVIDVEMWKFWGRRMTYSSLDILKEGQNKTAGIISGYVIWMILAALLGGLFWYWSYRVIKKESRRPFTWKSKMAVIEQVVIVILLVIGSRGGLQKKPLTPVNADAFERAQMNQLSLNTSFMLLKTVGKNTLPRVKYFPQHDEALKLVNGGINSQPILPQMNFTQKQNVVILILESFSWEYTGLNPENHHSYTPFLDSLMKRSLTFTRAMASGRRSIEGVAAIMSGIPALMEEPFITSEFSTNQFVGLGEVLDNQGYDTSFYHGADNGTMHFDAFTAKAGIRHYFGKNEYPRPEDSDGVWGIYDRPYLKYFADQLTQKKQPFFSALFTLSSHQPYKLPPSEAQYDHIKGPHKILRSISYTDSVLADFFKYAEKQPWYSNTLFIISADHTGPQVFTDFDDYIKAYRIPILFFHPQIPKWPEQIDRQELVQQIDIPASLYDFLKIPNVKTVALSRSVFRPGPRTFTAFIPGLYLQTDGKTVLIEQHNKQTFVDFDNYKKEVPADPQLEKSLKAVKEVFSEGLWDNALYF